MSGLEFSGDVIFNVITIKNWKYLYAFNAKGVLVYIVITIKNWKSIKEEVSNKKVNDVITIKNWKVNEENKNSVKEEVSEGNNNKELKVVMWPREYSLFFEVG